MLLEGLRTAGGWRKGRAGRRRKDPVTGICCYPLADPLEHLRRPAGDASARGNCLELFAAFFLRLFDTGNGGAAGAGAGLGAGAGTGTGG